MKFAQMLDYAEGHPTRMITGDSEILRRSSHADTYLTKSEVNVRLVKMRTAAVNQCLGALLARRNAPDPSHTVPM